MYKLAFSSFLRKLWNDFVQNDNNLNQTGNSERSANAVRNLLIAVCKLGLLSISGPQLFNSVKYILHFFYLLNRFHIFDLVFPKCY